MLDFAGPNNKVTALGQQIADRFSAALAESSNNLHVLDRSQIADERNSGSYPPEIVLDLGSARMFGEELGANAIVTGVVSVRRDKTLALELEVYSIHSGKKITHGDIRLPATEETDRLGATELPFKSAPPPDFLRYATPNGRGYSLPRCISCPAANYTQSAQSKRVQGVVELVTIINANGEIEKLAVIRGLPGGLTEQAIEAAKRWKLKPAIGPDGNPVAVREMLEVQFQLF